MIISGQGTVIRVVASVTFPGGFTFTQASDDSDFIDVPALTIADQARGANGDPLFWATSKNIELTVNVIPDSPNDNNFELLGDANRPGQGRRIANDVITMTIIYPNGKSATLNQGRLLSYMPLDAITSATRLKSKPYAFAFGDVSKNG